MISGFTVTLQVAVTLGLLFDLTVMVTVPDDDPAVTTPSETEATDVLEEDHSRDGSVAFVGVTVALSVKV